MSWSLEAKGWTASPTTLSLHHPLLLRVGETCEYKTPMIMSALREYFKKEMPSTMCVT